MQKVKRLRSEFDGVVGRSEGEGSAGARRGSCGCRLWDRPIRLLGASGEALRLRSEFDGVVGRSEGEGSAGARRGSCGCRLWDPRIRVLGAGGEALRLLPEFDGVVGRSEGEGSAGARRGSCGCRLWDRPIRLLGASGEALRLLPEFDGVVGRSEGEGSAGARRGSCGCRLWDPRIRVLGAGGEALRLLPEFDGVVGRSEGEGSAGARRGSSGCHLCNPPIRLLGVSGEAHEPSVQRPYWSCRRRIYRNSQLTVKKLGASWFERASRRPDVLPDRAPRCVTSSTQDCEEEIAMDHSSASLPAPDGPPSCDAPDPSPTSVTELGASWFERASRRPDVLPDRAPRCVTSSTQDCEEEIAMDHSSASLPAPDGPPSCDAPDPSPTSVTELGASWFERASRRPDVLPDRAPRCVTSSTQDCEEEIAMDHSSASLPAPDGPPSCDAPDLIQDSAGLVCGRCWGSSPLPRFGSAP